MSCPANLPAPSNRPGLPAIAYRVGDYATFRDRLLSRLTCPLITEDRPEGVSLSALTTRSPEDPVIALLDAVAVVADVLTFYQERIANEGFLMTATERRSVLELARSLGYELDPGVAASVLLAFQVDDAPGSPEVVTIPVGTQIMSIPVDEELPQTFETQDEFVARLEWNALQPRLSRPQVVSDRTRRLYLEGLNTQLQPGDRVLLMDGSDETATSYLLTIATVEPKPSLGHTIITWIEQLPSQIKKPPRTPILLAFRQQARLFGHNAPDWNQQPIETQRSQGGILKGGVFQSVDRGNLWSATNAGIPAIDCVCVAARSDLWLVGTPMGVYRSKNRGGSWEAASTGLTNLSVQSLYREHPELGDFFAGTAAGGLFRSKDGGDNWVPIHTGSVRIEGPDSTHLQTINTGLPNTVVRSILSVEISLTGTGTIASEGTKVIGQATKFKDELKKGDQIIALGQTKTIAENVNSDTEIRIDSNFTNFNILRNTNFSAFGSDPSISVDRRIIRIDRGTVITNNQTVRGTNTQFFRLSNTINPTITLLLPEGEQTRSIVAIQSNTSLTVNQPFTTPNLDPATPFQLAVPIVRRFLFVGTDEGIYRSEDQGKNWHFMGLGDRVVYALCQSGSTILAATDRGIYRSTDHVSRSTQYLKEQSIGGNQIWSLVESTRDRRVFALTRHPTQLDLILAGTGTGMLRSQDRGVSWTVINDAVISQQRVTSLAFDVTDPSVVIAGTDTGLYRSTNQGSNWASSNRGVTTLLITAVTTQSNQMLAATRFSGIANSDWPSFEVSLRSLDLDTAYPKLLTESWVVVLHQQNFAARRVQEVSTQTVKQFTLTAQSTRMGLDRALPNDPLFPRRDTVILGQSEVLPLIPIPLTIPVQQSKIFQAPIHDNEIALREFIPGLQPQQSVIISGKRIRTEVRTIAGVFRSTVNIDGLPKEWKSYNTGFANSGVTALATDEPDLLYAGTVSDGLFISRDRAQTWKPIPGSPTPISTIQTIAVLPSGILIVGTAGHGAFRVNSQVDPPEKWQSLSVSPIHTEIRAIALHPTRPILLAGTTNGGVFRSIDEGSTWSQTTLSTIDVQAFAFYSSFVFAGTVNRGVFYSRNDGVSWNAIAGLETMTITALSVIPSVPEPYLLVGTAGSGVFRLALTTFNPPAPVQWEASRDNPPDLFIRALSVLSTQRVFAATSHSGLYQSIDQGLSWSLASPQSVLDPGLHPTGVINTDIRAIATMPDFLFVAGVGVLMSPDTLSSVPIQRGDRLFVLAPPQRLQGSLHEWQLEDRNGFVGRLVTEAIADLHLIPALPDDAIVSEVAEILIPPEDQTDPILFLTNPIQRSYDPETVIVQANVVAGTHGEAFSEVLGSGDGLATHQTFGLKKPPLTYVSAPTVTGSASSLQVRVNEVLWKAVPSLYGRSPREEVYMTRIQEDGSVTVTFGDGESGARLPSGLETVTAIYRSGIGRGGNVAAGQLRLLKTRPLGISEVNNPLAATGGSDPETMDEARESAPRTVRTLDRIVSLQDYEDFARAFVGIGKAQAVVVWTGETQEVHVTVAGINGAPVTPDTALYQNLVRAIDAVRDPIQQVQVDSYETILFNLEATLRIDPRFLGDSVIAQVRTALLHTFTFEHRNFAQPVTASEAIATMQAIPGVIAVDLDAFHRRDRTRSLNPTIPALPARWDREGRQILPAQLLSINPAGVALKFT